MNDLDSIVYRKEVIEFVAVALEYCNFIEDAHNDDRATLLEKLQKFIPLIYLKGSLLPECQSEEIGILEDYVSEHDYNQLQFNLNKLLGDSDEYLEVFDENMQYNEAPVVNSISEKLCDIYQDLKNFISAYRNGLKDTMEEALWNLNSNFELYWGKSCVNVLRAIHVALYKVKYEDIDNN